MLHRRGFLKFIHLMNVTSRIFITLSFVSKINAYLTRQFRQAEKFRQKSQLKVRSSVGTCKLGQAFI